MNLAKNLIYLILSDAFGKVSNFIVIAYLSRILLPEGIGLFNWILSVILIIILLPSYGLNEYGILEIAGDRTKENIENVVGKILGFRLIIGILTYFGLLAFLHFSSISGNIAIYFKVAGLLVFSIIFSFDWFYTAIENQFYIGIVRVITRLLYLVFTILFVETSSDILPAIWLYTFSELIFSLLLFYIFKFKLNYRINITFRDFFSLFKSAFPLALYTSSSLLIYSADVAILGSIASMHETGLYSSAIKIISLFISLKYLFGQILYPKIVKQFTESQQNFSSLLHVINKYSVPASVILVFLLVVSANLLITIVLGNNFTESSTIFILLIPAIFCEFCWIAYPYAIITANRVLYTILIISVSLTKLALVPLIYKYVGLAGCAISYSLMNILLFIICIFYVHRKFIPLKLFELVFVPLTTILSLTVLYFYANEIQPFVIYLISTSVLATYIYYISKNGYSFVYTKEDYRFLNSL